MLERIKTLENRVQALEDCLAARPAEEARNTEQLRGISPKYRKLADYLRASNEARVTLSYSQLEEILGFTLPDTARRFKASFWANTKTHSYASSWMAVGYKTQIDPHSDKVAFIKS